MSTGIKIQNLSKYYSKSGWWKKQTQKTVLQEIDLELAENEVLGIVGESGCGKTTLAKVILGLEPYQQGTVTVLGQELQNLSNTDFKQLRRHLQVIFQDPYSSLDPRMTVRQILSEPWDIHGLYKNKQDRSAALAELIKSVGLDAAHLDRYPHEFSGGQRQRISIARALALEPKILVADEPVSALDVSVQAQILNLLKDICSQRKISMVFISHDFGVARFLCDRIAVMYQGRILEVAPAEELLQNPQHPYTEALLAAVPVPDPAQQKTRQPLPLISAPERSEKTDCPYALRCAYYDEKICEGREFLKHLAKKAHICCCAKNPFENTKSRWAVKGEKND